MTVRELESVKLKFAIVAIIGFVASIFLGYLGATIWQSSKEVSRSSIDLEEKNSALKLSGSPGQKVSFFLTEDKVVGGHWDTEGLKADLNGVSQTVVSAHEDDWGKAISLNSTSNFNLKISGEIVVPEVTSGQTLPGTILGSMKVPRGTSADSFSNSTISVLVPVELTVLTAEEAKKANAEAKGWYGKAYPIMWGIAVISALIGLVGVIAYFIASMKKKKLEKTNTEKYNVGVR